MIREAIVGCHKHLCDETKQIILKEKIDFILNVYISFIFKNIKNYLLEEITSLYTVSWNPCETKKR